MRCAGGASGGPPRLPAARILFAPGPLRGLDLVETLPGIEALITAPDLASHTSSGFPES